jgi:glycosyltransferase involved in cell wall biosynthesis
MRQTVRKWRPFAVQLEYTQMAQYAAAGAPARTILVEHDITYDLYEQLLARGEDWEARRQLERWRKFERAAWGAVDRVVTMSEKDRDMVVGGHAVCLPNGVDLGRFRPSGRQPEPARLLFIGSFAHLPNILAVEFFLREVWPLVAPRGATLHIIAGARHKYYLEHSESRTRVDLRGPGLVVEDFVADVRPAYERATVVIAPLVASAGTNIKIMEAMAMGKAVVSTPAGINGLNLSPGRDVIVVSSGEAMARAIIELLDSPGRRVEIEREARATVEREFDWDVIAHRQEESYESLRAMTA